MRFKAPLGNISCFWIKGSYGDLETVISKESRQSETSRTRTFEEKKRMKEPDKTCFKKNEYAVQF